MSRYLNSLSTVHTVLPFQPRLLFIGGDLCLDALGPSRSISVPPRSLRPRPRPPGAETDGGGARGAVPRRRVVVRRHLALPPARCSVSRVISDSGVSLLRGVATSFRWFRNLEYFSCSWISSVCLFLSLMWDVRPRELKV
jgi:hypothetical protein